MDLKKINHVELPQPDKLLLVESLDYDNPYNHKKLHRHDYFELILVEQGSGSQLIDFTAYDMNEGEAFMIYPGQVHLMERNTTEGLLLQFRKNIFEYIHPIKHYHLYFRGGKLNSSTRTFKHLYEIAGKIQEIVKKGNQLTIYDRHKAYSYLQIILLTIAEENNEQLQYNKTQHLLEEYLSLLTTHINVKKKVSEYCQLMNCTPEKLNEACKTNLGKTALELIHEELLLEIRRLLILNELSFKEIAYTMNFDTQGNFNAFIKSKTGLTLKELQKNMLDIYN